MKKNLINFSLSLFTFAICILLVELFFQYNSAHHLIQPKLYRPQELIHSSKNIPDETLKALVAKYQNFEVPHYELRNEFTMGSPAERLYKPFSPELFIEGKESFKTNEKNIFDVKIDPIKKIELFSAQYKFDDNRIRITEGAKRNPHNKNIVLVGCSMTFGTGVNQGEDLSSYLTQHMPKYNVYNMGIPGGGLSDFLDDIFIFKRLKLNQNGGAVIYVMIYDHLERTFCSLDCYGDRKHWVLPKNYYDLNQNNELVNFGSHQESKPIKYFIYSILAKSEFLRFIGFERPKVYKENEIAKYLEFVKTLKSYYKNNYNLDFYIYIPFPSSNFPTEMVTFIAKHDIKSFVYASVPEVIHDRVAIVGDGHWNKLGNDYQALVLTDYLKSEGY